VPDVRFFSCNLCEALCGLRVTVEANRVLEIRGDPEDVFSHGHICPKGPALRELHDDPDRLRTPMRRTPNGWEPIGWDEALREAAERLRAIRTRHGKDAIAFYVGNPTVHSHRAALGAQLLTLALGSRNRFDPNSQDSNPRLFACMQVYGEALSVPVPDVDRTDYLLILGANPAASNGSMMSLGDVRRRIKGIRERGGRIVLVDPRRTETSQWADEHHFIRPGGDAAFLLAMVHVLFAEGRVDERSVDEVASGRHSIAAVAERFSPERVAQAVGMKAEVIRRLAREFASSQRAVVYGRVGTCQNEFGPMANWLLEVLNVVSGHFDREGCAMFAQPAADIAPLGRVLVGNNYARWRSRVRGLPEFLGALPSAVMAEEMETEGEGQVRALVCFAGNPVLSTPNGTRLARALGGLDYVVAIDHYLNETGRYAHLVLPPTHIFESGNYDVLLFGFAVRNVARYSPPILATPTGALDDWQILSELALRLWAGNWSWLARSWRRWAFALPERIVDWLLRFGRHRLTLRRLRSEEHGVDLGPLAPARREKVKTDDGRVRLAPEALMGDLPRLDRWIDAREQSSHGLVLIGRRNLRSNNSWMHNLRSLAKGPDRARLLIHPFDATERKLTSGMRVRVSSRIGEVRATVEVTNEVMRGVVSLPHGFGHVEAKDTLRIAGALPGPSANAITDDELVEPVLGTSILNGVPVSVTADVVAVP
jgi:anaerobic selenocysteine-containing dehydrogenase